MGSPLISKVTCFPTIAYLLPAYADLFCSDSVPPCCRLHKVLLFPDRHLDYHRTVAWSSLDRVYLCYGTYFLTVSIIAYLIVFIVRSFASEELFYFVN